MSISKNNSKSLVSVVMTCYNGRETLLMAMASLFCQTYDNWELIFVDDGSDDQSADLVDAVDDPRLRVIRLDQNYGRGVAYQKGNDEANGDFIAILDSDDWWYSTKLEKQISFLNNHTEVSLVGGGLIIVDKRGHVAGYRCCHNIVTDQMSWLENPPLAFATICMRKEITEKYSYQQDIRVAQDLDFLQSVCLHENFANLPEPLYAYFEFQSYSWSKMNQAWLFRIKALKNLQLEYPFQSRREIAKCWLKISVYWIVHVLGLEKKMVDRRSTPPTKEMLDVFSIEKQKVELMAEKITKKLIPRIDFVENKHFI
jgi:glycosyltransferase involved in cell wall biosynthesis